MKTSFPVRGRAFALAALLATLSAPARGATYLWQGIVQNDNWTTGFNWMGGIAPPSSLTDTDLVFGQPYNNASVASSNIDTPFSIHSLTFSSGAAAYTFTGQGLTLGAGGFTQNAASPETFNASVALGADQAWTLASGAGALTFNGGVNTTDGSGNTHVLTINAATTSGGGNTINGVLSGGGSLTKTGAGTLTLTGANTYTGDTTVDMGTLAIGNTGSIAAGSSSTLTVDATAASAATVNSSGSLSTVIAYVGNSGVGTFNQTAGTVRGSFLFLGSRMGSSGTYHLGGGTLTLDSAVVGSSGTGAFTQTGGMATINDSFSLGTNAGGSGTYTLGDGALTTGSTQVGDGGTGNFVQNGGTHVTGTLGLSGASTASQGTYTLAGGTLSVVGVAGHDANSTTAGTSIFYFAGGTLQARQDNTNFLAGLTTADVGAAGARIDTAGFNVAVAQNLLRDATNNANGSLTKLGAGTLTLTGTNTYTGGTNFQAGTLDAGSTGALGGAGTLSFTGGTLQYSAANQTDYSGRFSTAASQAYSVDTNGQNVTFATGLTSPGGSLTKLGAGTLTLMGTNTYTGGTTISTGTLVASSNPSALAPGAVNVAGGATLVLNSGTASYSQAGATTFTGAGTIQKAGAGSLTFGGSGTVTLALSPGGLLDVRAGTLIGSSSFQADYTNNQGGLSVASGTTFNGVEANVRVDALTGAGLLLGGYNNGGTLVGSTTVGVAGGSGTFSGIISDNSAQSGVLSLTKAGAGTQILTGTNTYSGGTTFAGGTLQAGSAAAFGNNGTLNFTGGTLQYSAANATDYSPRFSQAANQAYSVDTNGQNVTYATALTSSGGSLAKSGAGTLTLPSANTYTGATTVNGGTLQLTGSLVQNQVSLVVGDTADAAWLQTGTLTGTNGGSIVLGSNPGVTGTFTLNAGSVSLPLGGAIVVGDGGTGVFNQAGGSILIGSGGVAVGSGYGTSGGTYNLTGGSLTTSGTTLEASTMTSTFNQSAGTHTTRTLTLAGGSVAATYNLDGGTLQATGVMGTGNSVFHFDGGTFQAGPVGNVLFSDVATADLRNNRSFFDTQAATVTVTTPLLHSTVAGDNATDGGLTKLGSGTLSLAAANTYTGPTVVSAGTLNLANLNALQNSTLDSSAGSVTFASSANTGGSFAIGALMGSGNLALADTAGASVNLAVGGNNASTTYTGMITCNNSVLAKNGTGTLTLTGSATVGELDVNNGTLVSGGNLKAGLFFAGSLGTVQVNQAGGSNTASFLVVGYQTRAGYTLSGGTLTIPTGAFNNPAVIIGDSPGTSFFDQNGGTVTTPTLALTGALGTSDAAPTAQAIYDLNGGVLQVGRIQNGYGGNQGAASSFYFNGGTLQPTMARTDFLQGLTGAYIRNNGAFIDTQNASVTVAQAIQHSNRDGDNATDGGLTKLGSGTLTLTGANTYTGNTTVSAGILAVNNSSGSATGTGTVTVGSGATLGGGGIVQGALTIQSGGTLDPGLSLAPARLTLGNNLMLNAGSTLAIELGGTTSGSGYSQVRLSANPVLGGNLRVVELPGFTLAVGQTFVILDDINISLPVTGTFANVGVGNLYTDAVGNTFLVNYTAYAAGSVVPNDVSLTVVSVVPEPSAWVMLVTGTGLLGLGFLRRRRVA